MMELKTMMKPLLTLGCAAAVLLGMSFALRPVADAHLASERQQVMELLLPGSSEFTEEVYDGEDSNITVVFKGDSGYVVETAVSGYVDEMILWVGVDSQGSVTGLTVRDMAETFGLGRKAMTDLSFLEQFLGMSGDVAVGEDVDALTGATVTSKAVAKAVNSAVAFVTGADTVTSATEWGG